jgi:KICSTOR complex protein SZT2
LSTGISPKHKLLIEEVARTIKTAAKVVNQELLLKDLHSSRRCNNLLEPETSDELWKGPGGPDAFIKVSGAEDVDPEAVDGSYLEAAMHFSPGFFKCDIMYEHEFIIHPRLKVGSGRVASRLAIQALSGTLNKFAVTNRQNMFVLEDNIKDTTGMIHALILRLIN